MNNARSAHPGAVAAPGCREAGGSLVEITIVLCVGTILAGMALPRVTGVVADGRARHAAAFVASRLREAKQQAVTRGAASGLVFDHRDGRWMFSACWDGNANGLRRADVRDARDPCAAAIVDLETLFPGVAIAADGTIGGPEGDPPSADPVRFGVADIASFSPQGGATPGSLFLRSSSGARLAVRIAGATGRLRIFRYDVASRSWRVQ